MQLKRLKADLARFGGDDDGSHVILMSINEKGEKTCGLLSVVAFTPNLNTIILADDKAAARLMEEGTPIADQPDFG